MGNITPLFIILVFVLIGFTVFLAILYYKYSMKWLDKGKTLYNTKVSSYTAIRLFGVLTRTLIILNPPFWIILINPLINWWNKTYETSFEQVQIPSDFSYVIVVLILSVLYYFVFARLYRPKLQEISNQISIDKSKQDTNIEPLFQGRDLQENINYWLKTKFDNDYNIESARLQRNLSLITVSRNNISNDVEFFICDDRNIDTINKESQITLLNQIIAEVFPRVTKKGLKNSVSIHYVSNNSTFEPITQDDYFTYPNFKAFLESYIINLKSYTSFLNKYISEFRGSNVFNSNTNLSNSYIPPHAKLKNEKREEITTGLEKYVNEWLTQDDKEQLVILGEYGMGKSTFMKYYTQQLSEALLNGEDVRFPILISLTNINLDKKSIKLVVEEYLKKNLSQLNLYHFQHSIENGKILFLFDGLDELDFDSKKEEEWKNQLRQIWDIVPKNGNSKMLLSSRRSFFGQDFEKSLRILDSTNQRTKKSHQNVFAKTLQIEPLTFEEITYYINKLYNPSDAEEYVTWLIEQPKLYELAKRPFLLSMIGDRIDYYYTNNNDIKLTDVYNDYLFTWIERQLNKGNSKIMEAFEDIDEASDFVINFYKEVFSKSFFQSNLNAIDIFDSKKDMSRITTKILSKTLQKILKKNNISSSVSDEFINQLQSAFFITKSGKDYSPKHKSIQEYLIARKFADAVEARKFFRFFKFYKRNRIPAEIIIFFNDCLSNDGRTRLKKWIKQLILSINGLTFIITICMFFFTFKIVYILHNASTTTNIIELSSSIAQPLQLFTMLLPILIPFIFIRKKTTRNFYNIAGIIGYDKFVDFNEVSFKIIESRKEPIIIIDNPARLLTDFTISNLGRYNNVKINNTKVGFTSYLTFSGSNEIKNIIFDNVVFGELNHSVSIFDCTIKNSNFENAMIDKTPYEMPNIWIDKASLASLQKFTEKNAYDLKLREIQKKEDLTRYNIKIKKKN